MGKSEVLQILREGKYLTANEISELVDASLTAVHVTMGKLLRDVSEDLKFRFLTPEEKQERYGKNIGRTVKIYWLDE